MALQLTLLGGIQPSQIVTWDNKPARWWAVMDSGGIPTALYQEITFAKQQSVRISIMYWGSSGLYYMSQSLSLLINLLEVQNHNSSTKVLALFLRCRMLGHRFSIVSFRLCKIRNVKFHWKSATAWSWTRQMEHGLQLPKPPSQLFQKLTNQRLLNLRCSKNAFFTVYY